MRPTNGAAETILIKAGKKQGIKAGDKFHVESLEILDGEVFPTALGTVTVTALKGEAFAECKAGKKEGKERGSRYRFNFIGADQQEKAIDSFRNKKK